MTSSSTIIERTRSLIANACSGGSYFVGINDGLDDYYDSLSFTLPATC